MLPTLAGALAACKKILDRPLGKARCCCEGACDRLCSDVAWLPPALRSEASLHNGHLELASRFLQACALEAGDREKVAQCTLWGWMRASVSSTKGGQGARRRLVRDTLQVIELAIKHGRPAGLPFEADDGGAELSC